MQCLNCEKELKQSEGKREKRFCNSTCRSNYWQKKQVKMKVIRLLTPGSSITDIDTGEVAVNTTNNVADEKDLKPVVPEWQRRLNEYKSKNNKQ